MSKTRRNKTRDDASQQTRVYKRKKSDLMAPTDWEEDTTLYLQNLNNTVTA